MKARQVPPDEAPPAELEDTMHPRTSATAASVAAWVAQVLMAALFAAAAIDKLFGLRPETVQAFARMGTDPEFRYFVGTLELAGAIGLVLPRFSGLAAIELAAVMVGALLTHLFILKPGLFVSVPATLLVALALVAAARRQDIRATLDGAGA